MRFEGDAVVMLTAPFHPDVDPLEHRTAWHRPAGEGDEQQALTVLPPAPDPESDAWLRGSLTFDSVGDDVLVRFEGSAALHGELARAVAGEGTLEPSVQVRGLLFADGFGSVAMRIAVAGGWDDRRDAFLARFGPASRHQTVTAVRSVLLGPLTRLSRACDADASVTALPYFNQTYVASTSHPAPGRAALADDLRTLVYPRSADPLGSDSPWYDEFVYAGYAFSLLAAARPAATLDQLEQLLLRLDVIYARLAGSADAAEDAIRRQGDGNDIDWLVGLERRLRADYHAVITPTFSFDHHVLKLRDAYLSAWDTDALRARTESVLAMARQSVERRLAQQQATRVTWLNYVVALLTLLSLVATFDAAWNLWDRLTG